MVSTHDLVLVPDTRLRSPSQPVTTFDATLRALSGEMHLTMLALGGVGLAGVQVGVPLRIFTVAGGGVVDTFVNPTLLSAEGNHYPDEGCLSVPGCWVNPSRPESVQLAWYDIYEQYHEARFVGLAAQIMAHEMDHLDGKLLLDQVLPTSRGTTQNTESPAP